MTEPKESPAGGAYRELVELHAQQVYAYIYFLLFDEASADSLAVDSFRQLWRGLRRGEILGDAVEQLYRQATRLALRHSRKADGGRRGRQRAEQGRNENEAFRIIAPFAPDQKAAVLLAVWGKLGDRVAGVATGLGHRRVRDLVFAARQEFRAARRMDKPPSALCERMAPILSARRDGDISDDERASLNEHLPGCASCRETEAIFAEFDSVLSRLPSPAGADAVRERALAATVESPERRGVLRRLARLASAPALLVISLMVLVVIFRDCSAPSIKTGAGRTSDVAFVRSPDGILLLDTGSGRDLGRVAAGVVAPDGERVFSVRSGCRGNGAQTTLLRTDVSTLKSTEVGCIDGQLVPVAADDIAGVLYLADTTADPRSLVAVDVQTLKERASMRAPTDISGVFDPSTTILAGDRSALYTVGAVNGAPTATGAVLKIDLTSLEIAGRVTFPSSEPGSIDVIPSDEGRILAYDRVGGRIRELDLKTGQVVRAIDMPGNQTAQQGASSQPSRHTMALSPDGSTLYVAPPTAGILVLDVGIGQVMRLMNPDRRYSALAMSTDGTMLYGIEADGAYVVLDAATGKLLIPRVALPGFDFVSVVAGA
ncbi:MAG TPA: zf-HC2 domain-containing protein [Chloroflexota bacterium]|nr:zf-HC2 domain-containing protein [Chloroflexota bacterium]